MSHTPSVHTYVHARFREAFGQPHNTLGKDDHWQLQSPFPERAINLLLNGTREIPILWVFDSNDGHDGVFNAAISSPEHADELITKIQARIKPASK